MARQIRLHPLVPFVMKPRRSRAVKPRRSRAVLRLSLLFEQGADVPRELTCNVLRVYPFYFLVRAGLYCRLYTIADTLLKVQIKWRHGFVLYCTQSSDSVQTNQKLECVIESMHKRDMKTYLHQFVHRS